jgi:hypothetical protein
MGFEQQIDQWHEYYLAVAGAAAVLLGLVFIALSLHLEKAEAPGSWCSDSAPAQLGAPRTCWCSVAPKALSERGLA